jgi:hypothetical protein
MSLKQISLIFGISLISYSASAAVIWNLGIDDDTQDGNGDATLGDPATLIGP